MILTNEIKEILENVTYWDSCPQDYKDKINEYLTSENEPEALNIDLVSKSLVIEWEDEYSTKSGTMTFAKCDDIPKAINDFIRDNPDNIITAVK